MKHKLSNNKQKYTVKSKDDVCQHESGFTLVEMLAVIVVFIVIGAIMVSILVTTFRTSQKTDTIAQVRENGNYVMTQMSKTIRTAVGIISPFPCVTPVSTTTITVLNPNHDEVTYDCTIPPSPTPATIASNSASILDTTQVALVSCSFTCTQDHASELPVIQINFSLRQQSTSSFVEKTVSPISFQTSVVMRNIIR